MEEEPYAHENLVGKARRQDQNPQVGSVASLTESAHTESVQEAEPERCAAPRTFLLEPMILVLLFAYNFSCIIYCAKGSEIRDIYCTFA